MLAILAALGPTWDDAGPIVAQDLHDLNPPLLDRYLDRTVHRLELDRSESGAWVPVVR